MNISFWKMFGIITTLCLGRPSTELKLSEKKCEVSNPRNVIFTYAKKGKSHRPRVNFINILRAAFTHPDPKSAKKVA